MIRELLWAAALAGGLVLGFVGALLIIGGMFALYERYDRRDCQRPGCEFRGDRADMLIHEELDHPR